MRDEIVAIDLETTGLDVDRDAIIEVGVVRVKNGTILEEFSTLVDPEIPIPPEITYLTGIHPEDVARAPKISEVLPKLAALSADHPILAHNVGFDLGFLRRYGILKENIGIDTYDLASILLPNVARYSLVNLAARFGIEQTNAHRALDDARASAQLYWHLWNKLLELPYPILHEINQAARGLQWDSGRVFEQALEERRAEYSDTQWDIGKVFQPLEREKPPLIPNEVHAPLNMEEVHRFLGPEGTLAQRLPDYEHREQQIEMARLITESFNTEHHLMVEAGTGTGKSLAYLVPAIFWGLENKERVIIATNTINLQDQLILKDIPLIQQMIDRPFQASVLKGRGNYLCPRRFTVMRRRRPGSVDELRAFAKILVWLSMSSSGDRSELSLRGLRENIVWQRVSAEDEGCGMDRCRALMDGACPFYKARKTAESSHVLIVNHALLISDSIAESRVIPDYQYVVIDEAHQLEEAITNGLSYKIDQTTVLRRIDDLGGLNNGLLGDILDSARSHLTDKDVVKFETYIQNITQVNGVMRLFIAKLFKAVHGLFADLSGTKEIDVQQHPKRIVAEHRTKADFLQLLTVWGTLGQCFEAVSDAMQHISSALRRFQGREFPSFNDLMDSTDAAAKFFSEVQIRLAQFILEPDANTVYWLQYNNPFEGVTIQSAPLHVGPMMDAFLWQQKASVVLTSATLQTESNFQFIRERLYAEQVITHDVGSPFDYHQSTLLYLPTDMPEPTANKGYQRAVERGIIELAAALEGRMMVLFTSYAQLRETAQNITPRLALGNITVYDQIDGSSRDALLQEFKTTERSVLLGTKSFWQGVDVPGDALSALVIVRLPFAVPTDPVFAARSETYNNAFKEYALPDAILRFRQGFGRLIRTRTDRGIVAVFDSRITSKSYGSSFVESLPDCTIQYGSLDHLPKAAEDWLNRSTIIR